MSRAIIRRLHGKINQAQQALEAFLAKEYQRGDHIEWEIGGHRQVGRVERVYRDKLDVYNERTGKTRSIYCTDII